MDFSIFLNPEAAAALREGRHAGKATTQITQVMNDPDVELRPVFPLASTPEEASQYQLQVRDAAHGAQVIEKLKACNALETAYHMPPPELP